MTLALISLAYVAMWDERVLYLMSDGNVRTERQGGWLVQYCASDRADLLDSVHCADYNCNECYVGWSPMMERQGDVNTWHAAQTYEMRAELAVLKSRVENDMIEISKVQEVGAKYAEYQEWCGVYEQAFEELGIEVLGKTTDIEMTITLHMTVEANRRQRVGDFDFMRQSLTYGALERALAGASFFDHDFDESNVTVQDVSISEQ